MESCNIAALLARVAELVDAADSKSAVRKDVSVRLRSRARFKNSLVIYYRGFLLIAFKIKVAVFLFFHRPAQNKFQEHKPGYPSTKMNDPK